MTLSERVLDQLLGHGTVCRRTHQALADELGTVRRIITRLLSRFEAEGLVRLSRERIEVLDVQRLRALAGGQALPALA
jgi:CRP/FNR family transcriptional regulator